MSKEYAAERVQGFGVSVFSVWSQLAQQEGAINMGQGSPDFPPPDFVIESFHEAASGSHQYAPNAGLPALCQEIAHQTSRAWSAPVAPEEVTVTTGATEGIFASIQALINPGDEVLLIEPFYDSYPASVTMAGGVCRYVPLRQQEDGRWLLDPRELRQEISSRTRMLILNTPNNPTGKCFSLDELEEIASLCRKHDLLLLSDEVYDRMVYDGKKHHPIATLPGMKERTITLNSAGKTFSITGWKIGWAIAPSHLTLPLRRAHQWIPFSVATPLQNAVARMLKKAEELGYYDQLLQMYQRKRDRLSDILRQNGLSPLPTEGTYFVLADISSFGQEDEEFCRTLTYNVGVTAIPPSAFYSPPHQHLARHLLRFSFCKDDPVLEEAAQRLQRLPRP